MGVALELCGLDASGRLVGGEGTGLVDSPETRGRADDDEYVAMEQEDDEYDVAMNVDDWREEAWGAEEWGEGHGGTLGGGGSTQAAGERGFVDDGRPRPPVEVGVSAAASSAAASSAAAPSAAAPSAAAPSAAAPSAAAVASSAAGRSPDRDRVQLGDLRSRILDLRSRNSEISLALGKFIADKKFSALEHLLNTTMQNAGQARLTDLVRRCNDVLRKAPGNELLLSSSGVGASSVEGDGGEKQADDLRYLLKTGFSIEGLVFDEQDLLEGTPRLRFGNLLEVELLRYGDLRLWDKTGLLVPRGSGGSSSFLPRGESPRGRKEEEPPGDHSVPPRAGTVYHSRTVTDLFETDLFSVLAELCPLVFEKVLEATGVLAELGLEATGVLAEMGSRFTGVVTYRKGVDGEVVLSVGGGPPSGEAAGEAGAGGGAPGFFAVAARIRFCRDWYERLELRENSLDWSVAAPLLSLTTDGGWTGPGLPLVSPTPDVQNPPQPLLADVEKRRVAFDNLEYLIRLQGIVGFTAGGAGETADRSHRRQLQAGSGASAGHRSRWVLRDKIAFEKQPEQYHAFLEREFREQFHDLVSAAREQQPLHPFVEQDFASLLTRFPDQISQIATRNADRIADAIATLRFAWTLGDEGSPRPSSGAGIREDPRRALPRGGGEPSAELVTELCLVVVVSPTQILAWGVDWPGCFHFDAAAAVPPDEYKNSPKSALSFDGTGVEQLWQRVDNWMTALQKSARGMNMGALVHLARVNHQLGLRLRTSTAAMGESGGNPEHSLVWEWANGSLKKTADGGVSALLRDEWHLHHVEIVEAEAVKMRFVQGTSGNESQSFQNLLRKLVTWSSSTLSDEQYVSFSGTAQRAKLLPLTSTLSVAAVSVYGASNTAANENFVRGGVAGTMEQTDLYVRSSPISEVWSRLIALHTLQTVAAKHIPGAPPDNTITSQAVIPLGPPGGVDLIVSLEDASLHDFDLGRVGQQQQALFPGIERLNVIPGSNPSTRPNIQFRLSALSRERSRASESATSTLYNPLEYELLAAHQTLALYNPLEYCVRSFQAIWGVLKAQNVGGEKFLRVRALPDPTAGGGWWIAVYTEVPLVITDVGKGGNVSLVCGVAVRPRATQNGGGKLPPKKNGATSSAPSGGGKAPSGSSPHQPPPVVEKLPNNFGVQAVEVRDLGFVLDYLEKSFGKDAAIARTRRKADRATTIQNAAHAKRHGNRGENVIDAAGAVNTKSVVVGGAGPDEPINSSSSIDSRLPSGGSFEVASVGKAEFRPGEGRLRIRVGDHHRIIVTQPCDIVGEEGEEDRASPMSQDNGEVPERSLPVSVIIPTGQTIPALLQRSVFSSGMKTPTVGATLGVFSSGMRRLLQIAALAVFRKRHVEMCFGVSEGGGADSPPTVLFISPGVETERYVEGVVRGKKAFATVRAAPAIAEVRVHSHEKLVQIFLHADTFVSVRIGGTTNPAFKIPDSVLEDADHLSTRLISPENGGHPGRSGEEKPRPAAAAALLTQLEQSSVSEGLLAPDADFLRGRKEKPSPFASILSRRDKLHEMLEKTKPGLLKTLTRNRYVEKVLEKTKPGVVRRKFNTFENLLNFLLDLAHQGCPAAAERHAATAIREVGLCLYFLLRDKIISSRCVFPRGVDLGPTAKGPEGYVSPEGGVLENKLVDEVVEVADFWAAPHD